MDGIENVIEVYKQAISKVELYGPTNFAPILSLVNELTRDMKCSQHNQKYNILLIITDGVISDL